MSTLSMSLLICPNGSIRQHSGKEVRSMRKVLILAVAHVVLLVGLVGQVTGMEWPPSGCPWGDCRKTEWQCPPNCPNRDRGTMSVDCCCTVNSQSGEPRTYNCCEYKCVYLVCRDPDRRVCGSGWDLEGAEGGNGSGSTGTYCNPPTEKCRQVGGT